MPKSCDFGKKPTGPGFSVFTMTEEHADFLKIAVEKRKDYQYVCEDHFNVDEICVGPKMKKLKKGALPHKFENATTSAFEHSYSKKSENNDDALEDEYVIGDTMSVSTLTKSSQGSVWKPEIDTDSDDESEVDEEEENSDTFEDFSFSIVANPSILALLSVCRIPGCGAIVDRDDMQITRNGCQWRFRLRCHNNCETSWKSGEELQRKQEAGGREEEELQPAGEEERGGWDGGEGGQSNLRGVGGRRTGELNLLMSTLLLLCGLTFQPTSDFFKALKIPFVSSSTHYRYMRCLLYPVMFAYWLIHQSFVLDEVRDLLRDAEAMGKAINSAVSGDARFDSPGFRAMYATHYTVSLNTEKVLTTIVVNKRQTNNNSPAMETVATRAALEFLKTAGVRVDTYVTDRSSSVRALLSTEFAYIKHQGCSRIYYFQCF